MGGKTRCRRRKYAAFIWLYRRWCYGFFKGRVESAFLLRCDCSHFTGLLRHFSRNLQLGNCYFFFNRCFHIRICRLYRDAHRNQSKRPHYTGGTYQSGQSLAGFIYRRKRYGYRCGRSCGIGFRILIYRLLSDVRGERYRRNS